MIRKRLCSFALGARSRILKEPCIREAAETSTTGRSSGCLRFLSTSGCVNEDSEGRASPSGFVSTVFGATGFLGRYVVQQLVKKGSQVVVPYRGSVDECNHLKLTGGSQVVPIKFDVSDEDSIKATMAGSSVVINLIGRDYESHRFTFEELNVWIPERIARLADDHGSIDRFVHVSALGCCTEHPAQQYKTKAEGEEVIREYIPEATIFRPAHIFGPEDRLLNRWATFARNMPVVPIIGHGSNQFQPAHVADVAAAIVEAVRDDFSKVGKTFELGGPDVYTVNELVALVFEAIREDPRVLHLPFEVARLISKATIGDHLMKSIRNPTPKLITFSRNNIRSLRKNYVVSKGALTFKDLGIQPRKIEGEAVEYLYKYRQGGESSAAAPVAQTSGAGLKNS